MDTWMSGILSVNCKMFVCVRISVNKLIWKSWFEFQFSLTFLVMDFTGCPTLIIIRYIYRKNFWSIDLFLRTTSKRTVSIQTVTYIDPLFSLKNRAFITNLVNYVLKIYPPYYAMFFYLIFCKHEQKNKYVPDNVQSPCWRYMFYSNIFQV